MHPISIAKCNWQNMLISPFWCQLLFAQNINNKIAIQNRMSGSRGSVHENAAFTSAMNRSVNGMNSTYRLPPLKVIVTSFRKLENAYLKCDLLCNRFMPRRMMRRRSIPGCRSHTNTSAPYACRLDMRRNPGMDESDADAVACVFAPNGSAGVFDAVAVSGGDTDGYALGVGSLLSLGRRVWVTSIGTPGTSMYMTTELCISNSSSGTYNGSCRRSPRVTISNGVPMSIGHQELEYISMSLKPAQYVVSTGPCNRSSKWAATTVSTNKLVSSGSAFRVIMYSQVLISMSHVSITGM